MPTQLAGTLRPIITTDTQNGAPAAAELPASLAGTTRWLNELITGSMPNGTDPVAPSPPNRRGGVGHDHSGGLMGRPQRHTVWHCMLGYYVSTNVLFKTAPAVNVPAYSGFVASFPIASVMWIRGCWVPGGKTYRKLLPHAYVYNDGAQCDYDAIWYSPLGGENTQATKSGTLSANAFTTITSTEYLEMFPGTVQTFGFRLKCTNTAGASTSKVYVLSMGLDQTSTTA